MGIYKSIDKVKTTQIQRERNGCKSLKRDCEPQVKLIWGSPLLIDQGPHVEFPFYEKSM